MKEKPMIMEVFTEPDDVNKALKHIRNLRSTPKNDIKNALKGMLSENQKNAIKRFIGK